MSVYVNHKGYLPTAVKMCLVGGRYDDNFEIYDTESGKAVFSGRLRPNFGDMGNMSIGNFSGMTQTGRYTVRHMGEESVAFDIGPDVYDGPCDLILSYFTKQRCGHETLGWNSPCHLDDGRRVDNGQHQDVSGGWHDANDLRKWVSATINGMIGMIQLCDAGLPGIQRARVIDELRWGNKYFLAMQEPQGYIMNFCGGDMFRHADDNRWTNNIKGDADDRNINTSPCAPLAQFHFIHAQSGAARLTQDEDPAYSAKCLAAAKLCLEWAEANNIPRSSIDLGGAVAALTQLYKATGDKIYLDKAAAYADSLMKLQEKPTRGSAPGSRGYFKTFHNNEEPNNVISSGHWQLIGLCQLYEQAPDHPDAKLWSDAVKAYIGEYLEPIAARTTFNMAPFKLYLTDVQGGKRVGDRWYRNFMPPGSHWWVGNNANIASAGVGVAMAARIFGNKALMTFAQNQLDFIIGRNPYNASTFVGVGYNVPQYMIGGEFYPQTPYIPGAVFNGMGGDEEDKAMLIPSSYNTCEYWTPMVVFTLWLMLELRGISDNYVNLFLKK